MIAYFNRGVIREVLNEPEAASDFEQASILDPKNPRIQRARAIQLAENKKYEEGIALAQAADLRQALKAFAPWALLLVLLFAAGVWIVLQPMQMRGTLG